MKIKKPASASPTTVAGQSATIADRFRLDTAGLKTGASAKNGTISKKAATVALIAGGIALFVAGLLTYILYQHFEVLMRA